MIEDDDRTVARASRARAELEQTETAFTQLRQAMLEEIAASPVHAQHLREKLYLGVQALDGVRKALIEAVGAGDVANYRTLMAQHIGLRPE